jgi:hypothetical protein
VGEDWHISSDDEAKEEILEPYGSNVVRGLDQHVTRVSKRQQPARPQPSDKVGNDMVIGARDEAEGYLVLLERYLKPSRGIANGWAAIVVYTR